MSSPRRTVRRAPGLHAGLAFLLLSGGALAEERDQPHEVEALAPAEAGEADAEKPFRGPPQEPRIRLQAYQRVKLRADLDKGDASLAVYRSGASGRLSKFFGYIRLSFGLSGERSVYDLSRGERINSPPDPPASAEPWGVLSFVRFNLSALIPLGRSKWSVFAFGGVRLGWENGTEIDQGLSGSFGVAVGYRLDEGLTLQAGFLLLTRIEDSPFGFPIIGVRWKPTDWFRLETRGPGIEAGLKPADSLELLLGARYDNRQFRLEDQRETLADHIVEDQEVVVEVGASWNPFGPLVVEATVGLVAYQEFEVRDGRGETLYRSRTDPAPYLQLQVALDF